MASESLQGRVDGLVRANRFTIAVVFPLAGAVLLVASAEGWLPADLAYNPLLVMAGTIVMRLPLLAAIAPVIDRRAAIAIAGLFAVTYGIEFVGVTTGWPYGEFNYLVELGPMVAGIPLGLPLFYLPLVIDAYLLAVLLVDRSPLRRLVAPIALATVLLMDLVLDPGAVAIGFWAYAGGGPYYGVPLSNYVGWGLSASITVAGLHWSFRGSRLGERLRSCEFALDDLVSFALLWGAINLVYLNVAPVAIAAGLLLAIARIQGLGRTNPALAPRLPTWR